MGSWEVGIWTTWTILEKLATMFVVVIQTVGILILVLVIGHNGNSNNDSSDTTLSADSRNP